MHITVVEPTLKLLLECLRIPKLSNRAATSLDSICVKCASEKQMLSNFPTMLQVVKEVDSFNITSDATVKLIKGTSNVHNVTLLFSLVFRTV